MDNSLNQNEMEPTTGEALRMLKAMPTLKWLEPGFTLPHECQSGKTFLQLSDIQFYRIDEITYEKDYPRLEALQNVIASMRIPGVNLIYLLLGEMNQVNIYFGVSKNHLENEAVNMSELGENILKRSLEGNFRGSSIVKLDAEDLEKLRVKVSYGLSKPDDRKRGSYFAVLDGVPGMTQDKDRQDFQGIDRVIDVMMGDEFGLMLVATPLVKDEERAKLEDSLYETADLLALYAKRQLQAGENSSSNWSRSHNSGFNESTTEGYNKGVSRSYSYSRNDSTSESKGDSYTPSDKNESQNGSESFSIQCGKNDSESNNIGNSKQVTQGYSTQTAEQHGSQTGRSMGQSFDLIRKNLQNWQKYYDDILLSRLDCGRGRGIFVCSPLLFASNRSILGKLANVVSSIFSGDSGNYASFRYMPLELGNRRLEMLQNFQQPVLKIRDMADESICYGATARSKCLHFNNERAVDDFYAGCWMSTVELSRLAGLPQKETMGVRLRQEVEFGLNEFGQDVEDTDKVDLGLLVQGGRKAESHHVCLDKKMFDGHIFVAGVTGAGKTTTCQSLLESTGWPYLVIEPAKTEYRSMKGDDLLVFTLGEENVAPFRLNPLEFSDGESISARVDMLMASIQAAFDMEAAIPQIIERAIYDAYVAYGWNIRTTSNSRFTNPFADGVDAFPTLGDVVSKVDEVVKKQGFDQRLLNDYLGSIRARLMGLTVGAKGMMLNCHRSLDFDKLLEKKVVLELEEIRNGAEKSLIIGFIMTNLLVAIKRKFKNHGKVHHFTLVEEAHRLLARYQPGDNQNKKLAVETFSDMLAEVRKYGESMIITDQIPNKLTPDVLKNTNIKIVHRLFAQDDKDAIGATMALSDEQRDFLSHLPRGEAIVCAGEWPKAVQVAVISKTDTSNNDVKDDVLKEKCLEYYSSVMARGIFPGLEKCDIDGNNGVECLKKYLDMPLAEELEDCFLNGDIKPELRNYSAFKTKMQEKLQKMVEVFGSAVVARLLTVHFLSSSNEHPFEKREKALKAFIDAALKCKTQEDYKVCWDKAKRMLGASKV